MLVDITDPFGFAIHLETLGDQRSRDLVATMLHRRNFVANVPGCSPADSAILYLSIVPYPHIPLLNFD
jgi:hypothetical protein